MVELNMTPEQITAMLIQALQRDIENYATEATELAAEYAPMAGVIVGGLATLAALTWGAKKLFAAKAPNVIEASKEVIEASKEVIEAPKEVIEAPKEVVEQRVAVRPGKDLKAVLSLQDLLVEGRNQMVRRLAAENSKNNRYFQENERKFGQLSFRN
jgi:hypothetical protein